MITLSNLTIRESLTNRAPKIPKPKHVFDYEVNDRYHLKLDVSVLEEDIEKLKNQTDPTLVIPLQKALDNIKAKLDDEKKAKGIKQELMPTEDEDPWLLRVSEGEMNERLLLIDAYEPWLRPEQESLIPTESKAQLLELPTPDQKTEAMIHKIEDKKSKGKGKSKKGKPKGTGHSRKKLKKKSNAK